MKKYLFAFSAIGGTLAAIGEQYFVLIILVAFAICLDVISGLIKSFALGIPISSEKGTKGFWKKMALLFSMAFAFFLDISLPYVLHVVKIEVPGSLLFGSIVGVYIILNESISITENIYKTNKKSLPKWLKKILTGAKDEIDKGGEKSGKE